MRWYNEDLSFVTSNQIFVFGSNTQGRHGKGAALFAKQYCGAIYGQSKGLQGNSYGLCTKDLTKNIHPSISKNDIIDQIIDLYKFVEKTPQKDFYICYKGDVINLNGYTPKEMGEMFIEAFKLSNVNLSKLNNLYFHLSFYNLLIKILKNEEK